MPLPLAAHRSRVCSGAAARWAIRQLVCCRSSSRLTFLGLRCIRRQFCSTCNCRVRFLRVAVHDNRIDCSFSPVYAKFRAWKLYSSVHWRHANSSCSVFACASDGVCSAPPRAGLLFLSLSIPPPHTQTLADNRAPTSALRFSVQSRAAALFV